MSAKVKPASRQGSTRLTDDNVDLSVVVVTYNSEEEIVACLSSLEPEIRSFHTEMYIVDNGSTDHTLNAVSEWKRLREETSRWRLQWMVCKENRGYTHAMNRALQEIHGGRVLFLNPDTQVRSGALRILATYLDRHPDVGVVAPQLLNPDGSVQPSCRRFPRRRDLLFEMTGLSRMFPRSPLFNRWKMVDFGHDRLSEVDQPQGACWLTRAEVLETVGLLDERFPMFFSDVDWCRRVRDAGWKIVFLPEAKVVHRKGASVYRNRAAMIWSSHRSFYDYLRKYSSSRFRDRLPDLLLGAGLWITAVLRIVAVGLTRFRKRSSLLSRG